MESKIKRVRVAYTRGGRSYAFDTDLPVEVGTAVIVPGNAYNGYRDQRGTVTSLDSNYGGPCKWIKRVVDNDGAQRYT